MTTYMKIQEATMLNPLQLAYIGDVIWEAIVRCKLVCERKSVHHMHTECVQLVNANAQSHWLEIIKSSLSEQELLIVQRGRNAHARHPSPKNQNPSDYSESTGFEALIGFLYLTGNTERISFFCDVIFRKEQSYA